jgi:hypothetical protein
MEVFLMSRTEFFLSMVILIVAVLVVSSGCGTSQPVARPEATTASDPANHGSSDTADEQTDQSRDPEIQKALASLSSEDRALAAKQRVCPVTEESLGAMGTPVKVRVLGRDVLLCCAGCEEELRAKANEYLAKLPN